MISTLLLVLTISATPPADRCAADISRAEASAFEATRTQHACMDPDECRVSDELVTAAQAQLATVRQLCSVPAPMVSTADPFEAEAEVDDSDPGAWLAVQAAAAEATERFESAVRP